LLAIPATVILGSGMSRDNAETIRLFYEAEPDGEDILQYLDPAVELYPGIRTPDQDTRYVGHDGWKEFMVDAIGVWEAVDIEPIERLEATENRILAIDNWRFHGRDGIEIERELPTLFTFRDGLIVRVDGFTHRAEAVISAGLGQTD
jgi:hypothetical protein